MDIDGFLDLVKKRRSIREFEPDPIPDEYIRKIMEAGRWAMSGANSQPWEFVVVKNRDTIAEMERIYSSEYVQARNALELTRIEEFRNPSILRSLGAKSGWKDAPAIIVILGDLRVVQVSVAVAGVYHGNTPVQHGIANCAMLMHVAAAALGLGSQWVSIGPVFEGKFRDLLAGEVFTIQFFMPMGYPAYKVTPRYRRELDEIVHYERYDTSKYRSYQEIVNWVIDLRKLMKVALPTAHQVVRTSDNLRCRQ